MIKREYSLRDERERERLREDRGWDEIKRERECEMRESRDVREKNEVAR